MIRKLLILALVISPMVLCLPGCDTNPTGPPGPEAAKTQAAPNHHGASETAVGGRSVDVGTGGGEHKQVYVGIRPGDTTRMNTGAGQLRGVIIGVTQSTFLPSDVVFKPNVPYDFTIRRDSLSTWELDLGGDCDKSVPWTATFDIFAVQPNYDGTVDSKPIWTGTWLTTDGATFDLTGPDLMVAPGNYYRVTVSSERTDGSMNYVVLWFECVGS